MKTQEKKATKWILLIPATIIIVLVLIFPIILNITLSFQRYSLLFPQYNRFIGLENYRYFFTDPRFWNSLKITLYFTVVSVFIELVIGLFTAILLNQNFKMKVFLRILVVLPWAIPTVVNGVMWQWIFDSNYGALNGFLYQIGFIKEYINWLGSPFRALNCVVIADIWKNCWFFTIVLLGGLQAIPLEYYEAAYVDGANFWKRLTKITLPLLKPTLIISTVLRVSEAFKVFDIIYIMTKGGPADGTQVLSYFIYHTSFEALKLGEGAALSTIVTLFILSFAIILTTNLLKEEVEMSA